tara:strand:+ start:1609 stop:2751 length:1143 start_codon:yes stop_codon:yes gene_type:complete
MFKDSSPYKQPTKDDQLDVTLLCAIMILLALGMTMVASTSMPISLDRFGYVYYFTSRHALNILVALFVLICVYQVPIERWQKWVPNLVLIGLVACVCLLLFGSKVNGSKRWISLGFMNVQVSEFIKVIFILYLADFFDRKRPWLDGFSGYMPLLFIYGLFVVLLILEPDFGSCFLMGVIMLTLLFISPIKLRYILFMMLVASAIFALLIWMEPYRMERLLSFMDPWQDRFGTGYQLVQSQMAMARGGWLGVGLGHSMQKLFYLPESHTDFIFSVLVEELGGVTALIMLGIFALIIIRLALLGTRMCHHNCIFAGYIMFGWSQWIFLQVIINTGGTIGIMPIKGLTLPFISYGGSSLVAQSMLLGIVLSALKSGYERPKTL